ncbi:hypothetical protein [Quatrionicoccus australiensis]|uniref:hypothetical protein n=1 Tax=Quatrionicoccus australiensis TaxID=138118 RepID=UPI001CF900C9|nr:hypothetical protein [Quatrionicoccus australiensis]UCV16862.1 hypothetical protein KI612_09385 [Quatrionicoccus australiensis]
MNPSAPSLPVDQLAEQADRDSQRLAARLAQEVFSSVFRMAFSTSEEEQGKTLGEVTAHLLEWSRSAASPEAATLRLALLVSGLDQWGLAYTQTFNLTAIPALSALLGALRSQLDARADALFQGYFQQIEEIETDAIDFKVDLRRGIHLAIWHALIACETADEAQAIAQVLGSLMLTLNQRMPALGWRLLADALAHIQIYLLDDNGKIGDIGRQGTQQLLAALSKALPQTTYQAIQRQSSQVILGWQQARRSGQPS